MYCFNLNCKCLAKQSIFNPNHCGRHRPQYPKKVKPIRTLQLDNKIQALSLSPNINESQQALKILQKRKLNKQELIPEEEYDGIILTFLSNVKN